MNMRHSLFAILLGLYLVLWFGGVGSHLLWGAPPSDMPWTAPAFLLLAAMIVLVTSRTPDRWRLLLGGVAGFTAEVAGVRSGVIFGGYWYTDALSPAVFDVPLVMICAWLVLIAYIGQMIQGIGVSNRLKIIMASAWMTAVDLVIDPVAAGNLGYWRWFEDGIYYGIPAHNFAGWFVVSLIVFALIRMSRFQNVWARRAGLSIVLFFTAIAWIHGLFLAGLIGVGLCILHSRV